MKPGRLVGPTVGVGALAVVMLIASWIAFRTLNFERYHEYEVLFYGKANGSPWVDWLSDDAFSYPNGAAAWLIDFVPFLGLAGVLSYLQATHVQGDVVLEAEPRHRRLVVLLFAAFVSTPGGWLFSYRIPVAFVVGGAALALVVRWRRMPAERIAQHVTSFNRMLLLRSANAGRSAGRPPRLLRRLGGGFLPDAREAASVANEALADARAHAMELGPHADWWENARTGVRLGAPVAILPALHYLYALADQNSGALGFRESPFNLLTALLWTLNEYAFWLVASLLDVGSSGGRPGS